MPGTNDDYDTGLLICRALSCAGGFVIWIMFWTNNVPPMDKAGVYDWSIMSITMLCMHLREIFQTFL